LVFKDKKIGHFVNKHFISLKINALVGEGKTLREKYKVRGFPTVLFLDSSGNEIDRICGFNGDKEAYFKILGDYAEGKNTLRGLLSKVKKSPDDIDLNFKLGKKYVSRWERENAYPHFLKVLKLDPADKRGFNTESKCYVAVHEARTNKNIKPLLAFIANNSDKQFFDISYSSLVRYYQKMKNHKKVVEVGEEALKKMPGNIDWIIHYTRYVFDHKIEDKYNRGFKMIEGVLNKEPKKLETYMRVGYLYQNIKKYKKAEEVFLKCLKLWPDEKGPVYQLGRNTVFSGKELKKGISYFQEYLKHKPKPNDPGWADALWRMGMIYEKLGDKKQAIVSYDKALKLEPEHKASKEALEKINNK
jgi:tetratricopeptide (TPR) repeat protein